MSGTVRSDPDVIVTGTGPGGLTAAAVLARMGLRVALIGPRPRPLDPDSLQAGARTAALFPASMDLLAGIAPSGDLAGATARLGAIRIFDGFSGLLRAPVVTFRAEEIGLERLATNVPLAVLGDWLARQVAGLPSVRWHETLVARVHITAASVVVETTANDQITADLLVAADGRDSLARAAAGIAVDSWSYDQTAIVAAFEHRTPHADISTEIHRPGGPCTTVPLPDGPGEVPRSSLVWLERAAIAARLMALDDAAFVATLSGHVGGHTGPITRITPRAAMPMRGLTARSFGDTRVALVGETAHVFPPLGAQGLNLTLRDVAALRDCIAAAREAGRDIGGPETLEAYSRARSRDVRARAAGVGMINSALLTDLPGAGLARGAALHAIASVPALKRQIMRAGMSGIGGGR